MTDDNTQKDPQDTTQADGTTPPAQDQPAVEAQPAEQKPAEPAAAPAEQPTAAPAEPAAAPAEQPAATPAEPTPVPEQPAEAPAEPTPAPEQPTAAPAEPAPAPEQPAEPAPAEAPATETKSEGCKCPEINEAEWDKQKKTLDKAFYKTWSPRLFYYPFSFVIDVTRAMTGAKGAGYTVPDDAMILDTGGMFWSTVMVEVTGEKPEDKNVVSLKGKEVYTKVSKSPWKDIKNDIMELKKELGQEPKELYIWYTACPKCMDSKDVKSILIAVL